MREVKRWYLAGPMTGLPNYNIDKFNSVAKHLREVHGLDVVNPAENPAPDEDVWHEWLKVALRSMLTCDGIILMAGWERSPGARLERTVAFELGFAILYMEDPAYPDQIKDVADFTRWMANGRAIEKAALEQASGRSAQEPAQAVEHVPVPSGYPAE